MEAASQAGHWHFGAGDPTLLGWAITAGYFFATLLCLRAALACRKRSPMPSASGPWLTLAALAVALGVNKQLDFQTLFLETARRVARSEGWYEARRDIQKSFVVFTIATIALLAWRWVRAQRVFLVRHRSLFVGVALVLLYVCLRMAAINHLQLGSSEDDEPHALLAVELLGVTLWTCGAAAAPGALV